ncbi:hypothetical protein PPYR_11551 [Photinus pyralis]|uniref:PHD-type domain-containing protein n=2 Tax=Photinus pyralis TaxID=7054 RepID=A0A5N4ABM0_PHOPY|nr:uncharacterized protein LOC116177233 isoform X2 [Photinus pyralis]KAB0794712.1 hypothetical protein PPYR_11551 [Photinus pyralis]
MEDDLNKESNTSDMPVPLKNVEVNVSEEPKLESDEDAISKPLKVNGDTKLENSDASESSDYDNLVIDERPLYSRKRKIPLSPEGGFKGFKRIKSETDDEYEPPTNPYFNESLFELSELHNNKDLDKNSVQGDKGDVNEVEETRNNVAILSTAHLRKGFKKKKLGSPKLREYAQYLGLQPTVQFKCSRCTLKGFASLALLNEHQVECTGEGPILSPTATTTTAPSTNFRVTRKVYLCSACGTYYENWNLFLHMREIHKRFICLYCLGMFSQSEKLSLHLVTKHNCVPSQLNTEEDFFHVYKEPCYLMCCECEKVFSEQDNFFGHVCCIKTKALNESKLKNNTNKIRQPQNQKQPNANPKQTKNKNFIEHVTGDTMEEQGDTETNEKQPELDEPAPTVEPTECPETEPDEMDQVTPDNLDTMETIKKSEDVKLSEEEEMSAEKLSDSERKESESEMDDTPESPKYDSPSPQNPKEEEETVLDDKMSDVEQEDTRKVPKVTLNLRQVQQYLDKEESDDSDKLMMELEPVDEPVDDPVNVSDEKENKDPLVNAEPALTIAGSEVPIVELQLEHPLDKFDIQILLQKCLRETIPVCVYCNHARKIAVNGKQLGLHAIAEHRFSAIVNSITAEELIPESFVMRIKESLPDLQKLYFNLESVSPEEGLTFSHVYECFQCRYATSVHKELYLHNRKMHAKTILLCIMCKSNFYSYSELICHLCPGVYELNNDITFRCCMCVCDDLPSAFRLMVHLRKRHHACDVCLELCHNQSKLSNHVWKHKLHHLCYRCGIAYRNKPDITKHLFWKHGTESVLCKKCLQKKWPHIYHFCIPPSSFTCEECNLNFTKAVALKVHKRLHREETPHQCSFENCKEKFVSKKLLLKHEFKHREPPEEIKETQPGDSFEAQETQAVTNHSDDDQTAPIKDENSTEDAEKKTKPIVDVYDLPELNLSESDSDSDEEAPKLSNDAESLTNENPDVENPKTERVGDETALPDTIPVLENIWDDFKLYQASKEKIEGGNEPEEEIEKTENELPESTEEAQPVMAQQDIVNIVMMDHDYSLLSQEYKMESKPIVERSQSMDHDYCSSNNQSDQPHEDTVQENPKSIVSPRPPEKKDKKPSSSSGSSDSDSSSCTCGSNCSCSSSGSSSSSSNSSDSDSSSSEGRRKQQARRERRKQRAKSKKESETSAVDVVATDNQLPPPSEQHIEESDLDTTETETDEDFYDKQPQKLANKLIAEKRKELMLLAEMGSLTNGAVLESSRPSTPSLPETEALKLKKKSKSKKKKKKKRQKPPPPLDIVPNYQCQPPIVSPLTISLPKNSPFTTSPCPTPQFLTSHVTTDELGEAANMSDASLRASKRRRIPNKFYGYSSDEEQDKHQPPVFKWRKMDLPSPARSTPHSPLVVPPITIKTLPPPPPEEPPPHRLSDLRMPQAGFVPTNFNAQPQEDSGSESNESSSEDEPPQPPPLLNKPPNQPPLYCYCRCPYDEVSEMIGCDADDCMIEWFHFECVGIMVPPKGQWFCPDCRKKKQQRKDLALT